MATVEPLIEHIVRKAVSSPPKVAQSTESCIDNRRNVTSTIDLVRSSYRKYSDERTKLEESCRQHVEAEKKPDRVAAFIHLTIFEKAAATISNNIEITEGILDSNVTQ